MAYCTHCGTELPGTARFCPSCGKPAGTSAAEATTSAPVTAPAAEAHPRPATNPIPLPIEARPRSGRSGAGFILPGIVIVALLVIGLMLWSQRDGARPITDAERDRVETKSASEETKTADGRASEKTAAASRSDDTEATRTTVASLDAAFRSDPQGALARYPGPVSVSGTVAAVTLGATPSLSLEGRNPFNYVVANMTDQSQVADAVKGSRVTLTCTRVSALAGTTILQGCARN